MSAEQAAVEVAVATVKSTSEFAEAIGRNADKLASVAKAHPVAAAASAVAVGGLAIYGSYKLVKGWLS